MLSFNAVDINFGCVVTTFIQRLKSSLLVQYYIFIELLWYFNNWNFVCLSFMVLKNIILALNSKVFKS